MPRVVLVPGLGLFGLGRSAKDARDRRRSSPKLRSRSSTDAEAIGRFESIARSRHVRYANTGRWNRQSSAQRSEKPLAGQIAVVTGAGGAIGAATARAFARAGAEVALLDLDEAAASRSAEASAGGARGGLRRDRARRCARRSIRWSPSVRRRRHRRLERRRGVAGPHRRGRRRGVAQELRAQFLCPSARGAAAVRIMQAQGTGGCLLFNVSKQAVNPGPNFGPYGLPKAATLFLVRQYALDYGADGIRANAVNADRIRSGLLTDDMIAAARQGARRLRAGLHDRQPARPRSHGRGRRAGVPAPGAGAARPPRDVTTVDGGNIAAAPR